MILSIILPVYNERHYIEETLDSIIENIDSSQFHEIELIIIDDASTDDTVEIIKKHSIFNMVTLFVKDRNYGISDSRNYGLERATGEYILFIDGDDILINKIDINLIKKIGDSGADIIEFNAERFCSNKNGNVFKYNINSYSNSDSDLEKLRFFFKNNNFFIWCRIFKKSLLSQYKFPVGLRYEDLYLLPLIYMNAKKIHSLDLKLVGYRDNEFGITRNPIEKDLNDLVHIYEFYYQTLQSNNNDFYRIHLDNIFKVYMSLFAFFIVNRIQVKPVKKLFLKHIKNKSKTFDVIYIINFSLWFLKTLLKKMVRNIYEKKIKRLSCG